MNGLDGGGSGSDLLLPPGVQAGYPGSSGLSNMEDAEIERVLREYDIFQARARQEFFTIYFSYQNIS